MHCKESWGPGLSQQEQEMSLLQACLHVYLLNLVRSETYLERKFHVTSALQGYLSERDALTCNTQHQMQHIQHGCLLLCHCCNLRNALGDRNCHFSIRLDVQNWKAMQHQQCQLLTPTQKDMKQVPWVHSEGLSKTLTVGEHSTSSAG